MTRVIIGAAATAYEGWVSTNRETLDLLRPDDWRQFAPVEMALAEHVWEHLTLEEGRIAAHNCARYVPRLRVAVPDGNYPDAAYIARARLGECEGDHRSLYTVATLCMVFESAGYSTTPLEWWEGGVFHYRPWGAAEGYVYRSLRHDRRNRDGRLGYTSLIIDCTRGGAE
jgi:predicted SAM-dependent methyltransferase